MDVDDEDGAGSKKAKKKARPPRKSHIVEHSDLACLETDTNANVRKLQSTACETGASCLVIVPEAKGPY